MRRRPPGESFRRLVREIPFRVEPRRGVGDHDLGLVDREHVPEDEHLAQWYRARAVPIDPTDAPMIAAGFPDRTRRSSTLG